MSDAATLPADMLAPVNSIQKAGAQAIAGIKKAEGEEVAATKAKNEALQKEIDFDKQAAAENKNYDATHPFPHPDLKPWTQKPPENNPVQRFGSWASAFGILAGAVTKTGLASSLNASAAAMNAFRQNDLDAYDQAHKAWKENMEIAVEQATWEAKAYEHGWALMEKDQALGQAQLHLAGEQANNAALMAALKKGDFKTAFEITKGVQDFALQAPKLQQELGMIADQNRRLIQLNDEWKKSHPGQPLTPDVALANRVRVARESQVDKPITAAERIKLTDRKTSYEQVFQDIDFVKNNLEATAVGLGGKLGRPVEDLAEVMKLTDTDTRNRVVAALERIKQHYPNLTTGTTRQVTKSENERLEKIVGGQFMGSTVVNTKALLDDLESTLMQGYDTTVQELSSGRSSVDTGGGAGGGSAGAGSVKVGDTAKDVDGKTREFTGGDSADPSNWKVVEDRPSTGASGSWEQGGRRTARGSF